jgi:GT2 family glycosyltransferase
MDRPAISVLVVAYRQRDALIEALRSCLAAAELVPGGAELIVVDNGSLAGFIRAERPEARLIEPGRNLGFAGGVQRGLREARGEWIALVNDDARIEPDALARMLGAGQRDPRIGSVAAQIRFARAPDRINSAGIAVDVLGIAAERLSGEPVSVAGGVCEVFGPSGCVALYRRAMLDAIGGFDERFFAYLEDADVAWRARAAGWVALYEPHAIAYHQGSASAGEGSASKYSLVGRNRVRLLARNATTAQLMRALPGIVLYDLAYVLYVALADRTPASLTGRIAGLREWRSLRAETRASRRRVPLGPARRGWLAALRQHRAYLRFAADGRASARAAT